MSDVFFPFAVQHIKVTYTYLDNVVTSTSFGAGVTSVSLVPNASNADTIKAFYGVGTANLPLTLIDPSDYVAAISGVVFNNATAKAGKVQYKYNAYTETTETLDVTGLNLTLSHEPVSGYAITVVSEDDTVTYVNGTDYRINSTNSRIIELIPSGAIVGRNAQEYFYSIDENGTNQLIGALPTVKSPFFSDLDLSSPTKTINCQYDYKLTEIHYRGTVSDNRYIENLATGTTYFPKNCVVQEITKLDGTVIPNSDYTVSVPNNRMRITFSDSADVATGDILYVSYSADYVNKGSFGRIVGGTYGSIFDLEYGNSRPNYTNLYDSSSRVIFEYSNIRVEGKIGDGTYEALTLDQDYVVPNYVSICYPAENKFIGNHHIQLLDDNSASNLERILINKQEENTWNILSHVVKNPDNIPDLTNHPVVYRDEELVYGDVITPEAATTSSLGLVSIGDNINVDVAGEISVPVANTSTVGVVSIGNNIDVDANGNISVPTADTSTQGLVSIGSNINVSSGEISVPVATASSKGVVSVGSNVTVVDGEISIPEATSSNLGLVQVGSNIDVSNGEISVPLASDTTNGVVSYDSNLFKTDVNSKLSLQNLFYKRSYRGVTASLTANSTESVTINYSAPNGYSLLTTEVRDNSSLCCISWTQTTMVENYSSGSVQVSFRNLDSSAHAFNYIIELVFVKTDLLYHEYIDLRT